MARRSRKSAKGGKLLLHVAVVVAVVLGGVLYVNMGNKAPGSGVAETSTGFNIPDYRTDASRLTGNTYRIEGTIRNIETQGNDRLIAVAVAGNKQELLPLLVHQGVSERVNLTRGDTFIFEADCRSGLDDAGQEVKGILVVRKVETKR